jgi:hypothetical protein
MALAEPCVLSPLSISLESEYSKNRDNLSASALGLSAEASMKKLFASFMGRKSSSASPGAGSPSVNVDAVQASSTSSMNGLPSSR